MRIIRLSAGVPYSHGFLTRYDRRLVEKRVFLLRLQQPPTHLSKFNNQDSSLVEPPHRFAFQLPVDHLIPPLSAQAMDI